MESPITHNQPPQLGPRKKIMEKAVKSSFVKYLGSAHINGLNLALYTSGAVRVENVINGKSPAAKQFDTPEAAEQWFDDFDGENTERTHTAIESLLPA